MSSNISSNISSNMSSKQSTDKIEKEPSNNSSLKSITINPNLFMPSSKKTKKTRNQANKKTLKSNIRISPALLRKKIKEHNKSIRDLEKTELSKKNKNKLDVDVDVEDDFVEYGTNIDKYDDVYKNIDDDEDDDDDFKDSFAFLQNINKSDKLEEPKVIDEITTSNTKHNTTLKADKIPSYSYSRSYSVPTNPNIVINTELPEELEFSPTEIFPPLIIHQDVPFGVLKGGKKPTYRNWMKYQTSTIHKNKDLDQNVDSHTKPVIDKNSGVDITKPHKKITKHVTHKTYQLGKSLNKKNIGVFIKNQTLRKKVTDATNALKKKKIQEVKKYLRTHNLIKAGSIASDDVLRKMYESVMLTGSVTNYNRDTGLHNLTKEEES